MRYLLLIIASFLLLGACGKVQTPCMVIRGIELNSVRSDYKYTVHLGSKWDSSYAYTDSLYYVGDTLCLTLKK